VGMDRGVIEGMVERDGRGGLVVGFDEVFIWSRLSNCSCVSCMYF